MEIAPASSGKWLRIVESGVEDRREKASWLMTWPVMSNLSEKLVGCDGETVGRSGSGLKLLGGVPRRGESPAVNEAIRLLRF